MAAAEELAAIVADEACFWQSFDSNSCHLELGEGCVAQGDHSLCGLPLWGCRQAEVLTPTRSDILKVLESLHTPAGFEQCQSGIVDDQGWRPCVPAYPDCQDWTLDNGRFVDLVITSNCDEIKPVLFDDPDVPDMEDGCNMNPNASAGTALPGERFSGPLTGGSLFLSTPLGDRNISVIGSNIGFRRLPCDTGGCLFSLVNLEIDFDDFELSPLSVTGLHAELASAATGIIEADSTATIEERSLYMEVTFAVGINKGPFAPKPSHGDKLAPMLATNDGPVIMTIDAENNIRIIEASFVFPSNVKAGLATNPASCALE
ncbi:MAG: hypothetical protein R6X02_20520 [Enhygromyxa sp.]